MVIIGLLAGILVPRVARARFQADLAACQSNLMGLGQAIKMYANDNQQQFPPTLQQLTIASGGNAGYIGALPTCPSNGSDYSPGYSFSGTTAFTIACQGAHNAQLGAEVSPNYPQFQTNGVVTK